LLSVVSDTFVSGEMLSPCYRTIQYRRLIDDIVLIPLGGRLEAWEAVLGEFRWSDVWWNSHSVLSDGGEWLGGGGGLQISLRGWLEGGIWCRPDLPLVFWECVLRYTVTSDLGLSDGGTHAATIFTVPRWPPLTFYSGDVIRRRWLRSPTQPPLRLTMMTKSFIDSVLLLLPLYSDDDYDWYSFIRFDLLCRYMWRWLLHLRFFRLLRFYFDKFSQEGTIKWLHSILRYIPHSSHSVSSEAFSWWHLGYILGTATKPFLPGSDISVQHDCAYITDILSSRSSTFITMSDSGMIVVISFYDYSDICSPFTFYHYYLGQLQIDSIPRFIDDSGSCWRKIDLFILSKWLPLIWPDSVPLTILTTFISFAGLLLPPWEGGASIGTFQFWVDSLWIVSGYLDTRLPPLHSSGLVWLRPFDYIQEAALSWCIRYMGGLIDEHDGYGGSSSPVEPRDTGPGITGVTTLRYIRAIAWRWVWGIRLLEWWMIHSAEWASMVGGGGR